MDEFCRRFSQGKRQLRDARATEALHSFQAALEACPVCRRAELSQLLYLLGITLLKLQDREAAIRSFCTGANLAKGKGRSAAMYRRLANGYGMLRRATVDEDDWYAFHSIHLDRYFRSRPAGTLSGGEGEMVENLLRGYWQSLVGSGRLRGMTAAEKAAYFRRMKLILPSFMVPASAPASVIPVRFVQKRRVAVGERCICGSGLPYERCCGRTERTSLSHSGPY